MAKNSIKLIDNNNTSKYTIYIKILKYSLMMKGSAKMNDKIKKIQSMSKEELKRIINNPESSEEDIIIASIEKGHKDIEEGNFYTMEEVIERFQKNNMVRIC